MYVSVSATTGEELFRQPESSESAVLAQLTALRRAQRDWAQRPVRERMDSLVRLADRLGSEHDALAHAICSEVGRCLRECQAEIDKSIALIRYYATLAPELLTHKTIATQATLSQVRFEPLGVIFAVMPWNYPVWQVLRFAVPALCSGNACLVKPAPSVPRVTQMLQRAACDSGLPLDVAWLPESVESVIAATDGLAFTGSSATGGLLAAQAGRHLKKCVLELGGSNAFIVLNDANLETAAQEAAYSRFRDAGQSCNAAKRIIVTQAVAEQFTALFLNQCRALKLGDPMLPETTLAPLHSHSVRANLHDQVKDALAHGAQCLLGGEIPEGPGFFYPATVLANVTPKCRIHHEEVFGPVAALYVVPDAQSAVQLANDTPFGLGASVYSNDVDGAWRLASKLSTGSVFINRHTSSDLRLPFGGVKDSGFGRELSEFGLYEFVNVKTYWQK